MAGAPDRMAPVHNGNKAIIEQGGGEWSSSRLVTPEALIIQITAWSLLVSGLCPHCSTKLEANPYKPDQMYCPTACIEGGFTIHKDRLKEHKDRLKEEIDG